MIQLNLQCTLLVIASQTYSVLYAVKLTFNFKPTDALRHVPMYPNVNFNEINPSLVYFGQIDFFAKKCFDEKKNFNEIEAKTKLVIRTGFLLTFDHTHKTESRSGCRIKIADTVFYNCSKLCNIAFIFTCEGPSQVL